MEKWDEKNNSIPLACHQQSDTETTKARKEEHRGRRGRNGRSLKKKRAKEGESQLDIQSSSPQTSFHQSLHQREESLSYAIVLHIAFKIYVPARIMQLDDCVEKTPINLILFGFVFFFFFFFFWLPFFLLQRRSNPLSLLSLAIICPRLHPDFCF